MRVFKLTVAYDGTGFVGWQRQAAGTSIQGLLEDALRELEGRGVAVTGAGRTDAGAHALGQVAHVRLAREIEPADIVRAVNARLPPAVRVVDASVAPDGFHARFSAVAKTYRYRIWNHEVLDPFERAYAWHVPGPMLDVEQVAAASRRFEGRHDFAAFQGSGSDVPSTVREVFAADVRRQGALLTFEITGDGFLRHMVRAMAGTLVDVGRGHRTVAWIDDVLRSRDRAQAGTTAPAEGLFLVRVEYNERLLRRNPNVA
jgi:tRNA pseudouridine38-40 synthase